MKSVRKVLKNKLPRYNLRSRKSDTPTVRSSTPKVNREVQVNLSDDEYCTLFSELPFCTSTFDVSPPHANGESFSEHVLLEKPLPQLSTAYSSTDPANLTNREAVDISIDSINDSHEPSIVHSPRGELSKSDDSSLGDIQPIYSSQVQSGPHIALEVENVSDTDAGDRRTTNISAATRKVPVINSPADLYTLVETSINYTKSKQNSKQKKTRTCLEFSSSNDSDGSSEESDPDSEEAEDWDGSEENREENEEKHEESERMEARMFKEIQEQMATMQAQLKMQRHVQQKTVNVLEQTPIPETSSSRRPASFHGYDSEDVNRWLDKIENYLTLRRITLTSPTALAELVTNLAGPAEDFYYSLPADKKATYAELRDSLRERFANDSQSWIIWQAASTRQQGAIEPLDTYLTDLTNKFRRLNITDAEKMRYFVQGLRPEIRETVLLRQPKTFREAEEIARLTCAVKTTMSNPTEISNVSTQLENLSRTMNTLFTKGASEIPTSNHALLAKIEELNEKLENQKTHVKTAVSSPENSVLAKLDALIDGIVDKPAEEQQSQVLLTKVMFDELLEKATRRIGDVSPREGNTASIAAFSEANKRESSEFLKEIRRMENTFTDKLESLYRRVDNRMDSLAQRNQTYRTEQADNREYNRRAKPVCYRCGRIGHIQYNCSSYYQPEDQHQNYEGRHEYRTNYNPPQREFEDQRLEHQQSSAHLYALDAQYARRVQDYHNNKTTNSRLEAQTFRQPVRTLTVEEENLSDHVIAALPKQNKPDSQENATSTPDSQQKGRLSMTNDQHKHVDLSCESNASLKPSDLTTAGEIAGQAVQLLVDTGACVSAIDKQFFMETYGQFPPKMTDGTLSSIQTVSGHTVPVLGKVTVPLHLNESEYSCEFHVMENLAYDAILGRSFLQENRAMIDLDNSSITLKRAGRLRERTSTTTVPVMGTFLPRKKNPKEIKVPTKDDSESSPKISDSSIVKTVHRSQRNKAMAGFHQSLLFLMLIALYLLTASYMHMKDNDQPVIQKTQSFFAYTTQDGDVVCTPINQVNRKKSDQSAEPNERRPQRIKIVKSVEPSKKQVDVQKTSKPVYSSNENSFSVPQENNVYPRDLNNEENSSTIDQEKDDGEREMYFTLLAHATCY